MKFIAFFVKRPVATILLTVAALLSGLLALPHLPVSDLPDVDLPVISVSASNAGGSPEVMARTVAAPLERHLGTIAGMTQMESTSTKGETSISLGFEVGRDLNGAARDVQAAIRAARHDLPTTPGSDPSYHRANPNATPVLILAVTPGQMSLPHLYDLINTTLRPMLLQTPGVGDVTLMGSSAPAVRVSMNPLAFFHYGLGFEDLRAALASANAHSPKGIIDMGGQRYQLAVNDQATHAAQYRDLVIAYKNGFPIRLSDLATVTDSMQDVNAAAFFDGQPALTLMVRAQPGANLVGIVDAVKARIPSLQTLEDQFLHDPALLEQFWVSPSGRSASGSSASNTIRMVLSSTSSSGTSSTASAFRNQIANSLAGGANTSTGSAVATGAESLVPLSVVTKLAPTRDPASVTHIGYASSASIALELAPGVSLSQAEHIIKTEEHKLNFPDTITGQLVSDEGDTGQSTRNSELLILGAIITVYLTLGMLYENVFHPLTILSTIPSASIGAIIALDVFQLPFSGMATVAMLLLTGISLKNAILLIDFAVLAENERGVPSSAAIREASLLRLRPIVMTTCAAALGAVPLIIMSGYGAELRQPLGLALVGGLIVSQLQTMITTPALYLLVSNAEQKIQSTKVWQKFSSRMKLQTKL